MSRYIYADVMAWCIGPYVMIYSFCCHGLVHWSLCQDALIIMSWPGALVINVMIHSFCCHDVMHWSLCHDTGIGVMS